MSEPDNKDELIAMLQSIHGKPINKYLRPENWADDVVDELLAAYDVGGVDAAQLEWNKILARDTPKQVDAIVASGRFGQIVKDRK